MNFLIEGIAHLENSIVNPKELIDSLNNVDESDVKFGQIAQGDCFPKMLNSKNLKKVFRWINDNNVFIHYFNIDLEYWTLIDIIDDCIIYYTKNNKNLENDEFFSTHHLLKSAFHYAVREDRENYIAILKDFSFPCIKKKEKNLLKK